MNNLFFSSLVIVVMTFTLHAENNDSNKTNKNIEHNKTVVKKQKKEDSTKTKRIYKHVKEQMEKEKEYAAKQSFAQGDDYDLAAHEVDPNALPDVPVIEPDYDFDITDVYRDDL
jgi:uncharacterized membrane protein